MSFHPLMAYDERFHKSERKLVDEGPAFTSRRSDGRRSTACCRTIRRIKSDRRCSARCISFRSSKDT